MDLNLIILGEMAVNSRFPLLDPTTTTAVAGIRSSLRTGMVFRVSILRGCTEPAKVGK